MAMLVLGVAVGQDATILAGPERDPVDAIPQGVAHDWDGCAGHRAHHLAGQSAEVLEGNTTVNLPDIQSSKSIWSYSRSYLALLVKDVHGPLDPGVGVGHQLLDNSVSQQ